MIMAKTTPGTVQSVPAAGGALVELVDWGIVDALVALVALDTG